MPYVSAVASNGSRATRGAKFDLIIETAGRRSLSLLSPGTESIWKFDAQAWHPIEQGSRMVHRTHDAIAVEGAVIIKTLR